MLLSLKWLQQFVDTGDFTAGEIATFLTTKSVEIDHVKKLGANLEHMVVGRTVEIKPHPDADKLQVVSVEIGPSKTVEVVCGGDNLRLDMLVVFADIGAKVKRGEELVEIRETKIRGVMSSGMICSASEIGMDEQALSERPVLDITESQATVGSTVADALGLDDIILTVDHKAITHRPDLWGHYGMARELAAVLKTSLKDYRAEEPAAAGREPLEVRISDSSLSERFMAVKINNVSVGPSPKWLSSRLRVLGVRPKNILVDIGNFVMLETGQPLHMYDFDLLGGETIAVHTAQNGENFEAINGKSYALFADDLVISVGDTTVDLAGIMGGKNTEVHEGTRTLVIEAAHFDPKKIRKTSQRLALRSEASSRFEKNLDPETTRLALLRAIALITEHIPQAVVASRIADMRAPEKEKALSMTLSLEMIRKKIGIAIPESQISEILASLGFKPHISQGMLTVDVPHFRSRDILIPEDIIEEIARLYGYDQLPSTSPKMALSRPAQNAMRKFERDMKQLLSHGFGMTEVHTYPFLAEYHMDLLGLVAKEHMELKNPLASDQKYLRRSLFPTMLDTLASNSKRGDSCLLYEIGKIFLADQKGTTDQKVALPAQPEELCGGVWISDDEEPLYRVKGIAERLLAHFHIPASFQRVASVSSWMHPLRCAEIVSEKEVLGFVFELHPDIAAKKDIIGRAAFFLFSLPLCLAKKETVSAYRPIPKYPAISLDVSLYVTSHVVWKDIEDIVKKYGEGYVTSVKIFDRYEDAKDAKQSIAFRVTYASDEKTLLMDEVVKIHDKILRQLEKRLKIKAKK
ncbi:MAG: phenylalanine--tRNA ligase subunit beta [Parcubacteria group bacterium]|nr:phenylalanine--tRNA ligase subunit beta [Parcubacteria group bacterium]